MTTSPAPSPLSALWAATSIAIIGATERPGAMGRLPLDYLLRYGFTGFIAPVNPKGGTILGLPVFANLGDVTEPIDLALIMVPAASVASAVRDCADAGVKACIVMSSGFAETGPEGQAAQDELVKIARTSGMRMVGPNCIGSVGGAGSVMATFSPVFSSESTPAPAGSIALVSQSGALGFGALSLAMERGVPIGIAVTTGNEAEVTAAEVSACLAADPAVTGLLMYVESLDDLESLRSAAAHVPVAVLKAGRSEAGALAAASHTGALATQDKVVDAALRSLGIARVTDIDDLLDVGAVFASGARMAGRRIGIVTTSGGSGILATDAIEAAGLELAQLSEETIRALEAIVPSYGNATNPVDVTAAVMTEPGMFERCLDVLADDLNVDAVVACFAVLVGDDVTRIANALQSLRERTLMPVVVARTGASSLAPHAAALLAKARVPAYSTPERAVNALAALATTGRRSAPIARDLAPVAGLPGRQPSEDELKGLLAATGLPIPESVLAPSVEQAIAAIDEVGGVAVCKAVVPGLLHKSDAGGVVLGVTRDNVSEVYERLVALGGDVLVERFVPGGVEVLVGITPSSLGRVLTVGVGGVLTEVIADATVRVLPVSEQDVRAMIDETRLAMLLAGVRGAAPADIDALVACVLGVADATREWPEGFELDLNPITVLPQGCWILDAAYSRPIESSATEGYY